MGLLRRCSRLPVIAVLVAAGLAVTACSGGSGGSSGSGTSGSGGSSTSRATSAPTAGAGGSTPASSPAATSGTSPSPPATSRYRPARATVIGKSTDVVVNPAVAAALKHAGITITAIAPATAKAALLFPVSGGQIVVATLAGTVHHSGGLTFRHGGKSVTLTNLIINTRTKHLTAMVGGRSMPVFGLDLAAPTGASRRHTTVVASNIKLTVLSPAAIALNSGLGVRTFRTGLSFGVATLTVTYARGHRRT
jgi:hypothetical protein